MATALDRWPSIPISMAGVFVRCVGCSAGDRHGSSGHRTGRATGSFRAPRARLDRHLWIVACHRARAGVLRCPVRRARPSYISIAHAGFRLPGFHSLSLPDTQIVRSQLLHTPLHEGGGSVMGAIEPRVLTTDVTTMRVFIKFPLKIFIIHILDY